jgi:hypothetical protein
MDAMDFSVNARAVAGLANALDLRAHDLTRTAGYLQAHSRLAFGAGLINELAHTHEHAMSTVQTYLHRAGNDYAEEYAHGVDGALRSYTATDLSASARLDATLPGVVDASVSVHLADQSAGPEIFADPACLVLAEPPDFEAQHPYEPEPLDFLSPSSIPRDTIWSVTSLLANVGLLPGPCDPYQTFVRPLCGDWAGLARTAFALTEVSRALAYVSGRVTQEATGLDRVWTGNAASNCRSALHHFALDLLPAADVILSLAQDYQQVADAARKQGEELATVVSLLVDVCGSLGVEFALKASIEAVTDLPKLQRTAEAVWDAILIGGRILEKLHHVLEGARVSMNDLVGQLAILPTRPLDLTLPDSMPVLPGAPR